MAIAAPGLGSNLDVNGIVTQLMNIEKQPLTQLAAKEASFQAQLSAYGTLKSALSSMRSALSGLSSQAKFTAVSAKPADTSVLSASALKTASVGSYTVDITKLAQPQSLLATGQSSSTAAIGTAVATTLTIDLGTITGGTLANGTYTGATFTADSSIGTKQITISSTSNTLQGIRDAINSANVGVKASIVNDGAASPYRLVLQSATTGANRSMRISASGDATVVSLLSYNPAGTQNLTQTGVAQDAALSINGVGVTSRTNSVAGAIEGITLTLGKVGSTSVSVERDTAAVQTAIQSFVKSYNEFKGTMDGLSNFDPATKRGGPLIGDTTLRSVESQLRQTLTGSLGGISTTGYSVLSQVGLSFQKDGTLSLDTSKLFGALSKDVNAVAALFASAGISSDGLVQVSKFSAHTTPSKYAVTVSQLATQGAWSRADPGTFTITAGVDDTITATVDGVSSNLTLTAGTYTSAEYVSHVESKINGAAAFSNAGLGVKITATAGTVTATSASYGSTSSVSITGTGVVGGSSTAGLDVAGTIGGIAATGKGQALIASDTSSAKGLELSVAGGALGDRGTIDFSRGYAYRLEKLLDNMVTADGLLAGRTDGIAKSIKQIDKQREVLGQRLEGVEARFRAQFASLDKLISSMTSTSNFLTQQLASLARSR